MAIIVVMEKNEIESIIIIIIIIIIICVHDEKTMITEVIVIDTEIRINR